MENRKKAYKTLFVVDVTLGDDAVKALVEKFTSLIASNGEIVSTSEWGKRRLAYPIEYKTEGYFVEVVFNSETAFPAELTRIFNITEGILRSMVTVNA